MKTHYLRDKEGTLSLKIEMGCNHPDMKGNSTDSVGCNGDCASCTHSIARMTIPECMELLQRAGCNYLK